MASFTRVKIKATVATDAMLVPEGQVDKAVEELQDNLKRLGVTVESIEPIEEATGKPQQPLDDNDTWTFRGQPLA